MNQPPAEPIIYAARITPQSLLVLCSTSFTPRGKEKITVNGTHAAKPYLLARLTSSKKPIVGIILHVPDSAELNTLTEVVFTQGTHAYSFDFQGDIDEHLTHLTAQLAEFHANDKAKLLYLLLQYANAHPDIKSRSSFHTMCHSLRGELRQVEAIPQHSIWLMPSMLYIHLTLPDNSLWDRAQCVLSSPSHVEFHEVMPVFDDQKQRAIGIIVPCHHSTPIHMTLMLKDQIIPLSPSPPAIHISPKHTLSAYLQFLQQQEADTAFAMRSQLNKALLQLAEKHGNEKVALRTIVKNLQLYVPSTPTFATDIDRPFSIHADIITFLPQGGIIVAGWIHDPAELLDSISSMDDCGRRYTLTTFTLFPYQNASDSSSHALKKGFIAHIQTEPYSIMPCSVKITAHLRGGLSHTIFSATTLWNARSTRDALLDFIGTHLTEHYHIIKELAPLIAPLQERIAETAHTVMPRIITYGKIPAHPLYSIVIPLYHRLEFVQAQLASFANDPTFSKAEIIYILDSPQQAEQFSSRLHEYAALYRLPITLLIMQENSGYALATNAGTKIAKGEWLVLLNSDVLPLHTGWLPQLSDFLVQHPDIGIIAPQLRYADDSIQHAGLYFAQDAARPYYKIKRYYKGFPANYLSATQSRYVPAVTAACAMIRRKLFRQVGMLSTEYMTGDYEDSDLCLKLYEAGYASYYFASAHMLHFERQSMHEQEKTATARGILNATYHHQRWHNRMGELMKKYEQ
jgi:GT2 family glycosyltransferase